MKIAEGSRTDLIVTLNTHGFRSDSYSIGDFFSGTYSDPILARDLNGRVFKSYLEIIDYLNNTWVEVGIKETPMKLTEPH
jgi:hypothetical protein